MIYKLHYLFLIMCTQTHTQTHISRVKKKEKRKKNRKENWVILKALMLNFNNYSFNKLHIYL